MAECVCSLCAQVPCREDSSDEDEDLLPMGSPGAFGLEQGEGQGEARIDWATHMEGQPPSEVEVGLADVLFAFEYELLWQSPTI